MNTINSDATFQQLVLYEHIEAVLFCLTSALIPHDTKLTINNTSVKEKVCLYRINCVFCGLNIFRRNVSKTNFSVHSISSFNSRRPFFVTISYW